jgi:hypothetical protein
VPFPGGEIFVARASRQARVRLKKAMNTMTRLGPRISGLTKRLKMLPKPPPPRRRVAA